MSPIYSPTGILDRIDPTAQNAYADGAPTSFPDFLEHIEQLPAHWLALLGRHVIGAIWLHDPYPVSEPAEAWVGLYVMPEWRGREVQRFMSVALQFALTTSNITHLYSAIHQGNIRGQRSAEKVIGLHKACVYPKFAVFNGQAADCVIYTYNEEDMGNAWEAAERRVYAATSPIVF